MTPVIAIVGRPNVGKSTLFNRLCRVRDAVVADRPGITRDRRYGYAQAGDRRLVVVDTGGLGEPDDPEEADLGRRVSDQALKAVEEADAVLWLVDGRAGCTAADQEIATALRRRAQRLYLVVNKTEALDPDIACADFHALGAGEPFAVSAEHGIGVTDLLERVLEELPPAAADDVPADAGDAARICVIGRPNVGKSTLINRALAEERMLTDDSPGTTRDAIEVPFERRGRRYILIDTAGVRRRARILDFVEKVSVLKSLRAMERADVVIAVVDAREGITMQDVSLMGLAAESGKSLIIAVNKWDGLDEEQRAAVRNQADRKLSFVDYACLRYISALHGTGIGNLFEAVDEIHATHSLKLKSADLTALLQEAVRAHEPPLVRGRRIKLRYAHLGGHNPLRIIVHGNQTQHVPDSYRRYLENRLRDELGLVGTPVRVEFKRGENPYKGLKTGGKAQHLRRRRALRHRKGRLH